MFLVVYYLTNLIHQTINRIKEQKTILIWGESMLQNDIVQILEVFQEFALLVAKSLSPYVPKQALPVSPEKGTYSIHSLLIFVF